MKRYLLLASFTLILFSNGYCGFDRVKLGLFVAPGISWMKPMGNEITNGVTGFGLQYGLIVDYYFTHEHNYAISTGLFGGIGDGGLHGRDSLTVLNGGHSVLERYTTNNVILPCYLKLKTNPFSGRFRLYGEVGFQLVFNASARATFNSSIPSPAPGGQLISIDKENVLRNGNEVQQLIPGFMYRPFDFRLSVGGGTEYAISERTAVFFAIHYNNGFINIINDGSINPRHDATVVRNVLFTLGAMF